MKILTVLVFLMAFIGCKPKTEPQFVPPDYSAIQVLLGSIQVEDQQYRKEIDAINKEYGWESDEMKNHWKIISKADSSNLVVVEEILAEHGWLGSDEIGYTANSTLFLVIQHSDHDTQEKYLPMMKVAVLDGNANGSSLALLEDRVNLGNGELQLYGSQVGRDRDTEEMYVLPLFEPENVNERRRYKGLGPIENYISHWDMEWDVEVYREKLPKWIKELKEQTEQ